MPDSGTQGNQQPNIDFSDILQNLNYSDDSVKNIDTTLRTILSILSKDSNSLASLRNITTQSQSSVADSKWTMRRENPNKKQDQYRSKGNLLADFEQGIKDQLKDSLAGGDFKQGIQNALSTFSKEFGFDLRNIGHEAGKALTKKGVDMFMNSGFGKAVKGKATDLGNKLLNKAFDRYGTDGQAAKQGIKNVVSSFLNKGQGGQGAGSFVADMAGKLGGKQGAASLLQNGAANLAGSGGGQMLAGKGGAMLAKGAASLGPYALLIVGIVYTIVKVLGPALKGLAEMAKALGKSFNREEEMRKKMLENSQKRLEADMKAIAEKPFQILQEAAEKWASTWDSNLRKIGQTQGYEKESVYALYESYAERLRSENLGSVINATDIVDKLSSVLDSGLTGRAAEEFAYIATKLGAAIPTQDFFGYVDTYASIAANAVAQGKSQEQALALANAELEQFASNLLYSSRELAGGFSTGLKNSTSLFQQANQIAQSAKSSNISEISGTLTSVSAIIGAVAPDLADSLVSNVVQAAIGGNNNSQLVALRSLAGINAGNTEFLRAMATDPKAIFSDLFTNLAQMQQMSPDNYMEVSEGLADVFGIDKAALARVDFNYLANAINAMQVNYDSLGQNLALLASGQTTTSAEQLKAQEINRVILEEGLAYVIDNEAGRMIQEHMWDEQRANALMENEYSVSIQGAALTFLEGIRKTMTTLMNFLNPIGFIQKGVANMTKSLAESEGNSQDLREILQLGAVGGNSKSLSNLLTRGKDLELTTSLVEMMGGTKGYSSGMLAQIDQAYNSHRNGIISRARNFLLNPVGGLMDLAGGTSAFNNLYDSQTSVGGGGRNVGTGVQIQSTYSWGQVGKSLAQAIQNTPMNSKTLSSVVRASSETATQFAQNRANANFQKFVDSAKEASKDMSYEQWVSSAKNFGISDFSAALDQYGRTEAELRNYFEQNEAAQGAAEKERREQEVRDFWDYKSGTSGIFQSAMWLPFFGDGMKYDTRMDAVDTALTTILERIGTGENHTVISGIEELSRKLGDDTKTNVIDVLATIEADIAATFMSGSKFQTVLADWTRYMASRDTVYNPNVTKAASWGNLKAAEGDKQNETLLALANAMNVFSADELKKLDPQLQANALLGEIVIILQAIMQQNNAQAGSISLGDSISSLALGIKK